MSWADETVTAWALCWRIERRDGVGLGLTAHDRDLLIDGNLYRASPGMTPSAIRRGSGGEADTMDVRGAFTAEAIREEDLVSGRWDGARVAVFAVDWADLGRRMDLGRGTIGAVELGDGGFTAELRGPASVLDRPANEETAPECRAVLGDKRCRVPMVGRHTLAKVVSVTDETLTLDAVEPAPDGWGNGRLRWLDGANAGLEEVIARSQGTAVTLRLLPRHPVAAGDRAELVKGCDKSLSTCAGRFGNAVNFRAEPFLPGIDLLTRYPGA